MTMHKILCSLLILMMAGCKKHTHQPTEKSLEELLTDGRWVLVGYGYDDNQNGIIDTDENLVTDCQKDNTTEYRVNGSGISLENQSVCMADPVTEFQWKFIDSEKAIEV